MKAELTLPTELIDEIVDKLLHRLNLILENNGKKVEDDIIFDVPGLAKYLNVSKQWVYERTHLKEIPHIKKQGLLRFRKKDIDKWLNKDTIPPVDTPDNILKAIKRGR